MDGPISAVDGKQPNRQLVPQAVIILYEPDLHFGVGPSETSRLWSRIPTKHDAVIWSNETGDTFKFLCSR